MQYNHVNQPDYNITSYFVLQQLEPKSIIMNMLETRLNIAAFPEA